METNGNMIQEANLGRDGKMNYKNCTAIIGEQLLLTEGDGKLLWSKPQATPGWSAKRKRRRDQSVAMSKLIFPLVVFLRWPILLLPSPLYSKKQSQEIYYFQLSTCSTYFGDIILLFMTVHLNCCFVLQLLCKSRSEKSSYQFFYYAVFEFQVFSPQQGGYMNRSNAK